MVRAHDFILHLLLAEAMKINAGAKTPFSRNIKYFSTWNERKMISFWY